LTVDIYEDCIDDSDEYPLEDYELSSNPNDFNLLTLATFIDRGVVKIPNFQRNYVWDIARASKLIESLLIGLPVPQIFFYEEDKNSYLVIDGQQRLMTLYYYIKGRFPKEDKRVELRQIFAERYTLPDSIINDDDYFTNFNLKLTGQVPNQKNKFNGKNYQTLIDYKLTFDLRTIRSIIVKQVSNKADDDTAVFELFNRLNTGGINLKDQEIRASLYHSDFLDMLARVNNLPGWRKTLGNGSVDMHMRDIEILLRCFAFLFEKDNYAKSVKKFLNNFAKKSKNMKREMIEYSFKLFTEFDSYLFNLNPDIFKSRSGRFGILLFELIFYYALKPAFDAGNTEIRHISEKVIAKIKEDERYIKITSGPSSNTEITRERYKIVNEILGDV